MFSAFYRFLSIFALCAVFLVMPIEAMAENTKKGPTGIATTKIYHAFVSPEMALKFSCLKQRHTLKCKKLEAMWVVASNNNPYLMEYQ